MISATRGLRLLARLPQRSDNCQHRLPSQTSSQAATLLRGFCANPERNDRSSWESNEPSHAKEVEASPTWRGYFPDMFLNKQVFEQHLTTQRNILSYVTGGGMFVAGSGVLAYKYLNLSLLDASGIGLTTVGAAIVLRRLSQDGSKKDNTPPEKAPRRFSFQLWNDQHRLSGDLEELNNVSDRTLIPNQNSPELPRISMDTYKVLAEKMAARKTERQKVKAEQAKHKNTALLEDLNAGVSIQEIAEKFSPRVFIVNFDTAARPVGPPGRGQTLLQQFTDTISMLVAVCSKYDEVVVKVSSPGGSVIDYGYASSQLLRLKRAGVRTTVCVDKVAASGGYMMACVADQILAAPFAFIGSIGVVAQLPNFNKVLTKNDIDFMLFTAGKYKRTVTVLGENTQEGIDKYQQDIEEIHTAFKDHVASHRVAVEIDEVATGETWLGLQAIQRGLVDDLMTSDEYIRSKSTTHDIIVVSEFKKKRGLVDLIERSLEASAEALSSVTSSFSWLKGDFDKSQGIRVENQSPFRPQ
ncbi:hypothetical protein CYMTET_44275 [Cymbomonas tetramitiformis]|uniref:Uncharacterized protein n=1 Tax=Cymbomonas tetramitiformis TaxID=36881 RepID=A0AAE0C1R0_9CHLO|nr:hypothetical protein CYMTET_44275 [Cymbomonas tetramitiformis]